ARGGKEFDGGRLRELRENLGLSRADVAEQLEVSYASVQNWESGDTTPRGENRQKVEELMEKSPEELKEASEQNRRTFDGERLTELKQELNISQGELAALLDVSNATVWSWETGRTTPSPTNVEKVDELEEKSADEVREQLEAMEEQEAG
ncbi:MAG: helix-turn-helix transcriptional regulator, partial [Planctomycetota bacterium]